MKSYSTLAATTTGITAVDCQREVRSWRLLRSLAELLIPTCNCFNITQQKDIKFRTRRFFFLGKPFIPSSAVTGTLFGYRHGKVSFCIQTSPKSMSPILLLELAIPTNVLAKEMKGGSIRIALERDTHKKDSGFLLSLPFWIMYCNGRKLGFAFKREPSRADVEVLGQVENVVVGAGIVKGSHDDVLYLRGMFERVHGSSNSESFHLVDPEELSFYFLPSR